MKRQCCHLAVLVVTSFHALGCDTGSSVNQADAGYVEIMTEEIVPRIDPNDEREWRNLKFVGMIECRVEKEKPREAALPSP